MHLRFTIRASFFDKSIIERSVTFVNNSDREVTVIQQNQSRVFVKNTR